MFISSAPARVCLYGEHQDYLNLKVIPAAINLRLNFTAELAEFKHMEVFSENIKQSVKIPLNITNLESQPLSFGNYLQAGYLALKEKFDETSFPSISSRLSSEIPIESGLSSSAALLVAWINLLAKISEIELSASEIAELAYTAEHDILKIPCGKMDQYASAIGSIISLELKNLEAVRYSKFKKLDASLIIVNSQTPKLTSQVHGKIVQQVNKAVKSMTQISNKTIHEVTFSDLNHYKQKLSDQDYRILKAVLSIRDDTARAEKELLQNEPDLNKLGSLLTSQQNALSEGIGVSLPILDKIVNLGIQFGALGGKLTGAGLGGCVVLLVPRGEETRITEKLREQLQLPVFNAEIDKGVQFKTS
ncbi:MAG: GHMP family kinase ATP-binding protein [Candidatus Heimdallarchaeaceae archaeon]